jgi:hypothetical protein
MKLVVAPLKLRDRGEAVSNLRDALLALLRVGTIRATDEERRAFEAALRRGQRQLFGQSIQRLVMLVQRQQAERFRLEPSGQVDTATADALGTLLSEAGLLDAPPPRTAPRLLSLDSQGTDVRSLQEGLRQAGFTVPEPERRDQVFGVGTREAVLSVQARHGVGPTGVFDESTRQALGNALDVASDDKRRVAGRILFDHGTAAGGIALRLYHRGFGSTEQLLGETHTDAQGFYAIAYTDGAPAHVEVRAVDGHGREVPLSAPKFNAAKREVLDLVAPAGVRPAMSEYRRLSDALAPHVGPARRLASAREDQGHSDLALLHSATGWDARLVALAAIAEGLGAESEVAPEAMYGLLRMGLPTGAAALARVAVADVEQTLGRAREAGFIGLDGAQGAAATAAFETFARRTRRTAVRPGALSSFADLLDRSGLSEDEKRRFEDVHFAHHGPARDLWAKVRAAGLPADRVDRLRLQGKLAYLTLDNAELTHTLQQDIGSPDDLARLVELDLYQPYQWKTRLNALAGESPEALGRLIPPAYEGADPAARLDAYAADLARKVRTSFPTQVVGRMVANDEVTLSVPARRPARRAAGEAPQVAAAQPEVKQAVGAFLREAATRGFVLGSTPVDGFVARTDVLAGVDEPLRALTLHNVKRLARLSQVTPGTESLQTLSTLGFDSARDVAAFTESEFAERYGDRFPSVDEARLVVRKARQVTAVAYSVVTAAKQLDAAPAVYALSPVSSERTASVNELIKHYPSLETLLGSTDFCECEHCRSVLSPAAYLVDLLQFVDPDDQQWQMVLDQWRAGHGGEAYDGPRYSYRKPFDALVERRPDLPHLPLTCENTQTELPYIDVVNEVLEYFVANSRLDPATVRDTGAAESAELLAEPQYVIREAYDKLRDARYPLALPFDLWIETVRGFLEYLDTPLWRVLEAFRPTDALFVSGGSASYDRAAIFAEYLGLSPSELALLANPADRWHELYGYAGERDALSDAGRLPLQPLDGPVALYRFDEIGGVRATDASGNGNHATLVNSPTLGQPGALVRGTAVSLNGRNQYVALPPAPFGSFPVLGTSTGSYALTFEAWFNAPPGAGGVILGQTGAGGVPGGGEPPGWVPAVHLGVDGVIRSSLFWHGATRRLTSADGVSYADGQWHHVAVTFGGGTETLYVDGVEAGHRADVQTAYAPAYDYFLGTGPTRAWIGGNDGWHFFEGRLDEVAVYSRALTDAQIAAHFAAGAATPGLPNAKVLARRLGISYAELTQIVQNAFVNPGLRGLGILWKLRLGVDAVLDFLRNRTNPDFATATLAFEFRLLTLDREYGQPPRTAITEILRLSASGALGSTLLLRDRGQAGQCNFDETWLEFGDGTPAGAPAFLAINLFVRLWKKLGWTLEETARALEVFAPTDAGPLTLAQLGPAARTAVVYLSHLATLAARGPADAPGRVPLLALWSDIDAFGETSLYARLFLTRSVLKSDPIFDHPLGKYLQFFDPVARAYRPFGWNPAQPEDRTTGNVSLASHLVAVQGAVALSADDITQILAAAGTTVDAAALSMAQVSLLYRHGVLARLLKLSVPELLALLRLSRRQPLRPLGRGPLATLEQDVPFTQTLGFIEEAEAVADSGLTVEDLEYLLRHRFDPTGKYRPNREATLGVLETLADGIRAIRDEQAIPDDPGAMSDEALRQKLGLALIPDVAERLVAMLDGTVEYTASETSVADPDHLHPGDFASEITIAQLAWDEAGQEQRLVVRGVLFAAQAAQLKARFGAVLTPGQQRVFGALLDKALAVAQRDAADFFHQHLEQQPLTPSASSGFLNVDDFDLLFDRPFDLAADARQDRLRQRRARLATAFLTFLQERLIRQFVVTTMRAYTGADPGLVEALLTDARLLAEPASLLEALVAPAVRGVDAVFFDSADQSDQPPPAADVVASADTALRGSTGSDPTPPAANSAHFEGYLQVPAAGVYRFQAELDRPGAQAELRFDHLPEPLTWRAEAGDGGTVNIVEPAQAPTLKPGLLYGFTLDLRNLAGGGGRLLVRGETLPRDRLAQLPLYPASGVARAERALLLLTKALQLVQAFGLSERETRYLLTHADAFDGLSLSGVPTAATDDTPAGLEGAKTRFTQFLRLAAYARLKRDLAAGSDDLIDVFEAAEADSAGTTVFQVIAKLMRRDVETVGAAAFAVVGIFASFNSEQPLRRLWEALQIVTRVGVPVASLPEWTQIVAAGATPQQRFDIACDLRNSVRARFAPEAWQRLAQPIFDTLRRRQRDALVSHVMQQNGFDRLEQLFEYFLIDPGMEPVVQTSRVRLAISSVQTFVQRCLLGLEPKVHPSVVNPDRWQWMKRYRVWEANRKLFLFPENWLEPEFRDDKTYLFRELEATLLQGDVSNDLVETAFFRYLNELGTLGRLEMVTIYLEEKPLGSDVLHVIGRTYSRPHRYFYRRHASQMWTPWEPVNVEIEGDHLVAAVFRDRLHLFWLTFLMRAKERSGPSIALNINNLNIPTDVPSEVEIRLNWSEYFQGEWTAGKAGAPAVAMTRDVGRDFKPSDVLVHAMKQVVDGEDRVVLIFLQDQPVGGMGTFQFFGANSPPSPWGFPLPLVWGEVYPDVEPTTDPRHATTLHRKGTLHVKLVNQLTAVSTGFSGPNSAGGSAEAPVPSAPVTLDVLNPDGDYFLLPWGNLTLTFNEILSFFTSDLIRVRADVEPRLLSQPYFYQDDRHTFFVEPSVTETSFAHSETFTDDPPSGGGGTGGGGGGTGGGGGGTGGSGGGSGGGHPMSAPAPRPEQRLALFTMHPDRDWLTGSEVTVRYGTTAIGRSGPVDTAALDVSAGALFGTPATGKS